MNTRTRILAYILTLVMAGAVIGVYHLNNTAGNVIVGFLAGMSLIGAGRAMSELFTRPAKPEPPMKIDLSGFRHVK